MPHDGAPERQAIQVPIPLIQRLLDYLASRPYVEVHELIASLLAHANAQPADPQKANHHDGNPV